MKTMQTTRDELIKQQLNRIQVDSTLNSPAVHYGQHNEFQSQTFLSSTSAGSVQLIVILESQQSQLI